MRKLPLYQITHDAAGLGTIGGRTDGRTDEMTYRAPRVGDGKRKETKMKNRKTGKEERKMKNEKGID